MKLLLDEMYDPAIARELRAAGVDAISAKEPNHGLAGLPDRELFAWANEHRRAIVTENVPDFVRLDGETRSQGQSHHGLVFTSNRGFPRARRETTGRIIAALRALASGPPFEGSVVWLGTAPRADSQDA